MPKLRKEAGSAGALGMMSKKETVDVFTGGT